VKPNSDGSTDAHAWENLGSPKPKGSLGNYEIAVEPTKAGLHLVHIKLHGQDISGSPVSFTVAPAGPSASKCKLSRFMPPESEPLLEKSPISILVTLFDKFSNQLDKGGIRVDAKASGVGVSPAKVEDNKDGTYMVTMTAGPAGEIKVIVRIDGTDLPPYLLTATKRTDEEDLAKEDAIEGESTSAPIFSTKDDEKKDKQQVALVVKDVAWMTPASLRAIAEEMNAEATAFENEAETAHMSFDMRLGNAILKKLGAVGKIQDLVRDWDKNGDGDINKIEFRQCVTGKDKKSLGLVADNKEIDAFFSLMDADGGGSLELSELKPALKKLQDRSAKADQDAANLKASAASLRERAAGVIKLAETTEEVEAEEKRLSSAVADMRVDAKIGALILKRNLKVGELVKKWDKDGDGTVTSKEFVANMLEMGVEVAPAELQKLFEKLDADKGGSLDLNEVKKTFQTLQNEAYSAQTDLKDRTKAVDKLRKATARQQAILTATRLKEVEDKKQADELAKKESAEREAADAEAKKKAKEDKKAMAMARADQQAAAKKLAEERVEDKRKSKASEPSAAP